MQQNNMLIIGISGQTGAGKSTTAALLSEYGFGENYEIDEVGHLLLKDEETKRLLIAEFGNDICDCKGDVDRKLLGHKVFAHASNLQRLNSIMHPQMRMMVAAHIEAQRSQGIKSIIVNAALLFSMKLDKLCNVLIFVESEPEIRLKRLTQIRGLTKETAEKRLFSQDELPADIKGIIVIKNNSDEEALRLAIKDLSKRLKLP